MVDFSLQDFDDIKGRHRSIKIEQVYAMDNLRLAAKNARRGKGKFKVVKRFMEHEEENLLKLQRMLMDGSYHTSEVKQEEKYCPCGKKRFITKVPYNPDNIVHHALMQVIYPTLQKAYYFDSYASIKGKGTEFARRRVRRFIDLHKSHDIVYAKIDFVKFYPNIDQRRIFKFLCGQFYDKGIRYLLYEVVTAIDKGLAIGLYPIQLLANLYVSMLARKIDEAFGKDVKVFVYCDDIVIMGFDTKTVWKAVAMVRAYAETEMGQAIHENINVEHITNDVCLDFVGYQFYKDYTLVRKKMKVRMRTKLARLDARIGEGDKKAETRKIQTLISYRGWMMKSNSRNLWHKTTKMRKFSDLKISQEQTDKNGNKFFNVPTISARLLVDETIVVKGIAKQCKTKMGEGRYAVWVESKGKDCKFITNNPRLKQILDICEEKQAFPFEATLRCQYVSGNKPDYRFE